jgi:thioredoxin 1
VDHDHPLIVTDDDFQTEVIEAPGIVVVDFWAPWCGPCLQMAPALEAFAKTNAGKAKVVKVDADDNPKTSEKYGIRSIPTLIFFKDGKPAETVPRQLSQAALQDKLDALLGSSS